MTDPTDGQETYTRPRWVKVLGILAAVLVAVVLVMALAGGDHGPRRHLPGNDGPAEHTSPPGGHD